MEWPAHPPLEGGGGVSSGLRQFILVDQSCVDQLRYTATSPLLLQWKVITHIGNDYLCFFFPKYVVLFKGLLGP